MRQLILMAGMVLAAQAVHAAEAGKVIFVAGAVQLDGKAVAQGAPVNEGELLTTGADGYLYVKTVDQGLFILRPNSKARIVAYQVDKANPANTHVKLELLSGVARSQSGEAVKQARQNFRFNTPVAAIGVRGTDFTVFTDQETSRVAVLSGGVTVSSFGGACRPEGGGPCEGTLARELFANQKNQLLQVKRGQAAPQLLQGNGALAPDVSAPPRGDEPAGKTSSVGGSTLAAAAEPGLDIKKGNSLIERANQVRNQNLTEQPVVTTPPIVVTPEPVAPKPVEPPPPPPPPLREVSWGRWQTVVDHTADSELSKAGAERLAYNNFYVLFRDNSGTQFVTPERGSIGFALADSEAVVFNQVTRGINMASLQNGKLEVDFGKSAFSTSFDLLNQDETFKMQARGTVSRDGRLYGDSILKYPTNMQVDGVLRSEGDATYLFQAPLPGQRVVSGVTRWKR